MNTKKAIILGTLGAILVGLCSFAFSKHKPVTTTPTIKTIYNEKRAGEPDIPEITTNITGTNWRLNEKPVLSPLYNDPIYQINFTSNNQIFNTFILDVGNYAIQYYDSSETIEAVNAYDFSNETWVNQAYRTIQITDGTDVTNTDLINWLLNNATQIENPVQSSIQNTSWKINNQITATAGYGQFSINFYSNGYKYNSLKIGYYAISANTPTTTANAFMFNNYYNVYNNGTWQHQRQFSRITITDGTDTTNPLLIQWLNENAQQMKFISNPINTKWTFENTISTVSISNNYYNIQFTTGRYQSFFMQVGRATNTIDYAIKTNNATEQQNIWDVYHVENVYNTYWLNPSYQTIIITGTETIMNDGVSNMFLIISFLQSNANGTSYTPIPTGPNDYDIEDGNFTSLQSLIFRILTLPFTFIAQAFNVTLWEGTAWEFNISNFILAIIAISAILFIIKLFTSGLSIIGNYTDTANTKIQTHHDKIIHKRQRQAQKHADKMIKSEQEKG